MLSCCGLSTKCGLIRRWKWSLTNALFPSVWVTFGKLQVMFSCKDCVVSICSFSPHVSSRVWLSNILFYSITEEVCRHVSWWTWSSVCPWSLICCCSWSEMCCCCLLFVVVFPGWFIRLCESLPVFFLTSSMLASVCVSWEFWQLHRGSVANRGGNY